METTTEEQLKVWVGCLACYNDGKLVGRWVDAIEADEKSPEDIHGMLTRHEELWCFDVEDSARLFLTSEMSPREAQRIAEGAQRLEDDGIDAKALSEFLANEHRTFADCEDDDIDRFQDAYLGEWDNERDFAEYTAAEHGLISRKAEWPYTCIDWEAATKELMFDYWSVSAGGGTLYVFRAL
jgi:antirestriction protein